MEALIWNHPWWTALAVYCTLSVGVVLGVWSQRYDDEDGRPSTTAGGYIIAFFSWWFFLGISVILRLFPNWGIPKRNRQPPQP